MLFHEVVVVAATQAAFSKILDSFYESLGALVLALVAILLAVRALRANTEVDKQKLEFEREKFRAEEEERKALVRFRQQESKRFSRPAADIAEHLAKNLAEDPHWARSALEAAKLLPYTDTLFDERSQHFRAEKRELAALFTPYLLKRCEALTQEGSRDVHLLVDAGTTLYPFFELLGKETSKRFHQGERWLERFHLATNNLPGVEQLIDTGRRTPWDRYSELAVDCQLLPGSPLPIFAAVAGDLTNDAIVALRKAATENGKAALFVALLVGNWVRIRGHQPRCPVPMARGDEHRRVKQTLLDNADEVYVVSPLGKLFVDYSNEEVNSALGFDEAAKDRAKTPYSELAIRDEKAAVTKLVATTRAEGRILQRHSNRVEDALTSLPGKLPPIDEFAVLPIEEVPHLLFPFDGLPGPRMEEFLVEFPHYHTRTNASLLSMFSAAPP